MSDIEKAAAEVTFDEKFWRLYQTSDGGVGPKWSKFIPPQIDPTPKQALALMLGNARDLLYGGAAGGGKIIYDDGCVLTPFGFKLGKDLKVGDRLNNPDGTTCRIIQIHPRTEQQVWRVKFHDGTFTDVAREHLWLSWRSGKRKKLPQGQDCFGEESAEVIETQELKQWVDAAIAQEESGKRPNWPCIPVCKPQPFNVTLRYRSSLEPYKLGYWLGDGHVSGTNIGFTTIDHKHFREQFVGEAFSFDGEKGYDFKLSSRSLFYQNLKSLKLDKAKSATKFVPREFLYGAIDVRLAVLQGLMDTDGTVDSRGQCYYTTISEQLRDDVCFLVRSLGGTATAFSKPEPFYRDGDGLKIICKPAYTIYIKMPDDRQLFRMERKKSRCEKVPNLLYRRVVSVEVLAEKKKGRCITVSHPNGLYITNDFIVTHNSEYLLCAALQYADIPGYSGLILRKHMTDLKLNEALLHRAAEWLLPWIEVGEVVYKPEIYTFEFATQYQDGSPGKNSRLQFGFLGKGSARVRYQGAAFQFIGVDEAGQHEPRDLTYMFSRLRKTKCSIHGKAYDETCNFCVSQEAIPLRYRLTANPGDIGHDFLKKRYDIRPAIDLRDGQKHEGHIPFKGFNPKKPFIPSYWFDNPHIDEGYEESLDETTGVDKEHLKAGNWNASPDARFKTEWARYYETYRDNYQYVQRDEHGGEIERFSWPLSELYVFTTIDPASTAREGPGDEQIFQKGAPSKTVISTWGMTPKERMLIWLNCVIFSIEIPDIIEEIQAVHRIWRPRAIICEVNGVGAGVFQVAARLGLPMKPNMKLRDKVSNASQALIRMKQGRILFPRTATWLEDVEGEVFTWFGHPYQGDDIVDTLSDAARHVAEATNVWYEPEEATVDSASFVPDEPEAAIFDDSFDSWSPSLNDLVL